MVGSMMSYPMDAGICLAYFLISLYHFYHKDKVLCELIPIFENIFVRFLFIIINLS